MILSAYEIRGEAKLFSDEEQIRAFYRRPLEMHSTTRSVTPQSPVTVMQPSQPDQPIDEDALYRWAKRTVRIGTRRVAPRLIPILGWGILAKDIYDIVTN